MTGDGLSTRERSRRILYRKRTRVRARTEAEEVLERATHQARRLTEGEELPSSAELKRLEAQLKIFDEHERRQAELAFYTARNEIHLTRARILTFNLVMICAWGMAGLLTGEVLLVSPSDLWHLVASGLGPIPLT